MFKTGKNTYIGVIIMGENVWYLNEKNQTDSSYTDFTYTDLTTVSNNRPVKYRNVSKAGRSKATVKRRKKSAAGKVLLCTFGVLAIALGVFLIKDRVVEVFSKTINGELFSETYTNDKAKRSHKKTYEEADAFQLTAERASYDESDPAYGVAENIMASLWRDNDIDTAWEIFNWVHSNIYYQPITTSMTFEEAAYRGFTRKSGDCYVTFACAKMLLDCAGIPNLMVERYPVYENSHYWNLVQLDGEWYHCDATVFKDHPDLYFMCTDDEIADDHHSFNSDLYPERASGYSYYQAPYGYQPEEVYGYWDEPFYGDDSMYEKDPYTEEYADYWDEPYYGDDIIYWDEPYSGEGPVYQDRPYPGEAVVYPNEPYEDNYVQ